MTPNRLTEEVDDYYHAGSLAPRSEEEQPRHSGVNKLKKARWGINFGAVTCVVGAVVAWTQLDEANVTIAVGSVFVLLIWLWTLVLVGLELGELRKSAFQHSRAYTWLSLGTLVALLVFFALGVWVFATRLIGSTNIKGTLWFIYLLQVVPFGAFIWASLVYHGFRKRVASSEELENLHPHGSEHHHSAPTRPARAHRASDSHNAPTTVTASSPTTARTSWSGWGGTRPSSRTSVGHSLAHERGHRRSSSESDLESQSGSSEDDFAVQRARSTHGRRRS